MSETVCGKNIMREVKTAIDGCAFVVTDTNVRSLYGELLRDAFVIEAGEKSKTPATLFDILGAMSAKRLTRGDTVAAVGGGVVGDITGLAAALYMRGINWVSVPTSLLAMVDSGIGGKTAVDFAGVKNLIGAFHAPAKIIVNAEFLKTLPSREWLCGIGELVKTCFLDASAYELLKTKISGVLAHDADAVFSLMTECIKIKSYVVEQDFKETGLRKILNVGHTVGHALESVGGYELSHGEYVIKGMLAELAMCKEFVDETFYAEAAGLLARLSPPPTSDADSVTDKARSDKKNGGGTISVMVPVKAGDVREYKFSPDEFAARYARAVAALNA